MQDALEAGRAVSGDRGATVEFRDIGMSFGSFEAVKQFNLTIGAGEFLTLLGPSGSGKTTVLNLVAGFLDRTSGDILIGGRSIASLPTEKRNVGMVFQNYSLFPHMSVADNVAFPLKMRHAPSKEIQQRVSYALNLVHLADYGLRMPHQLSGGQRQRIAFARAIVFEPKVLLMDEPLGALDLKLREHMQLEIKQYQEQIGCTVVYVTHDQVEALTLSDRIVIMNEGRIVQIGSPREVYDFPRTRFAAEFIGETNVLTLKRESTADGRWCIEEVACSYPARQPPGSGTHANCHLSVRPEKIARLLGDQAQWSKYLQFDAVVEDSIFLGDVVRYTVKLPGGATLKFKEHRTGATSIIEAGELVRLGFMLDDAVVLADQG